jgi:transposase
VLLVAQGIDYSKVGQLLGVSARSVENWMSRFKQEGLEGLREEKRPGRPNRLTEDQLAEVNAALLCTPHRIGLDGDAWDGKTLADWIAIHTGVRLGLRQCQRMIRQRESAMRDSHSRAAEAKQKRHKAQRKDSKP